MHWTWGRIFGAIAILIVLAVSFAVANMTGETRPPSDPPASDRF